MALLALSKCKPTDPVKTMISRGRKFLIAEQRDDGSWTETTRPPGNVSYAEAHVNHRLVHNGPPGHRRSLDSLARSRTSRRSIYLASRRKRLPRDRC